MGSCVDVATTFSVVTYVSLTAPATILQLMNVTHVKGTEQELLRVLQ